MLPPPDESLASLGSFIRMVRTARGIDQKRAAREARVSRRQLAILESGGNVSVRFLLKVARYLEIGSIPLDGSVQLVSGQSGSNISELLRALELLNALADHARLLAINAILPPSEQAELKDTPALHTFIARHMGNPEGLARLQQAMLDLSSEGPSTAPPSMADEEIPAARRRRTTSRRRA
jgi:transcriptional regulator with XRE-family HTH domain